MRPLSRRADKPAAPWDGRLDRLRRFVENHKTSTGAILLTAVFVGNVTIGTAFYERLTETASPSGYPWLVQPDVVDASKWARDHLGTNQRFGASTLDSFALATAGDQNLVSKDLVWPIFFTPTMSDSVVKTIRSTGVRYLLLDWRMTRGLPPSPGYYFSPEEPDAGKYQHVFPNTALRKFTTATACTRVLKTIGAVQVIDVSTIEDGTCVPGRSSPPARPGAPR